MFKTDEECRRYNVTVSSSVLQRYNTVVRNQMRFSIHRRNTHTTAYNRSPHCNSLPCDQSDFGPPSKGKRNQGLSSRDHAEKCFENPKIYHRRALLALAPFVLMSTTPVNLITQAVQAACLQGDTTADCIGVYKLPLDDEILPFIDTPEKLAKYAPDLRYVPPTPVPKSSQEAIDDLFNIHQSILQGCIRSYTIKGNLTAAGIHLLDILPRVAVDGKVVLQFWDSNPISEMNQRKELFRSALDQVIINMNQLDVMIGQALKGDLGALTPAQIQLLSVLHDVDQSYQGMMSLISFHRDDIQ